MTVYRLVHNGELPAVRVGRSFRVHAKAVHDLLETLVLRRGLARLAPHTFFVNRADPGKVPGRCHVSAEIGLKDLGSGVHGFSHQEAA